MSLGGSSKCPAKSCTTRKMLPGPRSSDLQHHGWMKETACPRAKEVSRNSGTTPFVLCHPGSPTMSVMFAKLHFIEYGYFPRGLLF